MKLYTWVLLAILMHLSAAAQPYQVGHISATFTDSARGNRLVTAEIYYPADVAGDNVAFASGIGGKVPVISFGHGFVMTYDSYFNLRDAIVPTGYIMAFATTEGSFSPSHSAFGYDLAFILRSVASLSNNSASVLYGKADTMTCVMGHSMGGGASFLAMSYDSSVKAIVTFAAAETSPSAIGAASTVKVPALVFAGINDCVSPPAANQQPMYDAISSACKQYIGIKGGSHCQMAESSVTCNFGEATCTPAPAITRSRQHAIIDTFLLPWLDHTLKGSCMAGALFDGLLATDTAITGITNCSLCTTSQVHNTSAHNGITVYPQPGQGSINWDNIAPAYTQLKIYAVNGSQLLSIAVDGRQTIDVSNYAPGVYIYMLSGETAAPISGRFTVAR